MTVRIRPRGPNSAGGLGFGLIGLFLASQAASIARSTGGGIRPAIMVGLFAAVFLRVCYISFTQRVVISDDELAYQGLFRKVVVKRVDIRGIRITSAARWTVGRPRQLVIRLDVAGRSGPLGTPFLRFNSVRARADLDRIASGLDRWRTTGDLSGLTTL